MLNGTDCNLKPFHDHMRHVHGYLSLFVCVFGSIANIINICVLTTREMRIPTNFILTGLAFSDLCVMLEYIPFTSYQYINPHAHDNIAYYSYAWAVYMYFHAFFTQVCHFNSCCLTVMLAVWRYIALNVPQRNKVWCSPERTLRAISASALICPFVCAPLLLGLYIAHHPTRIFANGTLAKNLTGVYDAPLTNVTQYYLNMEEEYQTMNFWIYGVVLKLLPCILLTVLSVLLIKSLWEAKRRWKNLSNSSGVPMVKTNDQHRRNMEKEQQADRTTRMLLAVLAIFLLPEFPQAIWAVLVAMRAVSTECYTLLGELFDAMALVGSSISFILYCSMSAQFRAAFKTMFKLDKMSAFCSRFPPSPTITKLTELNGGGVSMTQQRLQMITKDESTAADATHRVNIERHHSTAEAVQV